MSKNKFIRIAKIGKPHGIRGWVYLHIFAENLDLLMGEDGVFDKEGNFICKIIEISPHKNSYIAKIENIDDRNAVEALKNKNLYINKEYLSPITGDDDSFYYTELEDLQVIKLSTNKEIGKVKSVQNFGAGDILEIISSSNDYSFMIPFTKKFVPEVNIQGGFIKIDAEDDFLNNFKSKI